MMQSHKDQGVFKGANCCLVGIFCSLMRSVVLLGWNLIKLIITKWVGRRQQGLQELRSTVEAETAEHDEEAEANTSVRFRFRKAASADQANRWTLPTHVGTSFSFRCKVLENPHSHVGACSCWRCMSRMRSELFSSFEQARSQGYVVVTSVEEAGGDNEAGDRPPISTPGLGPGLCSQRSRQRGPVRGRSVQNCAAMSGTGISAAHARVADIYFFEEIAVAVRKLQDGGRAKERTRLRFSLEETKLTQPMESASDQTASSDSLKEQTSDLNDY
ncbi:hypothetical protein GUITHDRAFT_109584 [Guillardia theta CCMP2712]|uniref:Uncharacterized protein n=1 Tax=Guillardia theta (strain CCMP2712) TaxID=905079 RepID=L1J7G4_GUITC|nr:hypothetical protein GUITHDRAFT_109584 [Guillardia theta CCMP2712]EKX44461.1 hypothetical protein GUITHDRAFT_109584 [Guillardia theta CCMP2712]|eukprot:XP_005831441.1 hypothetical protein GUITHDRAFT_109584 [Guillardia theta CCMP2712]